MKISVNAHTSIKVGEAPTIRFDPFKIENKTNDADVILITHPHYDHFSPEDIEKVVKEDTCFVFPASMKTDAEGVKLPESRKLFLAPGEKGEIAGVEVTAVPAYNIGKPFHTGDKEWVGYIVNVGGKRIYVAGDTDCTPEMLEVECDAALIPVGGKYTMNPKEAAEGAKKLKAGVVIPTHYGSIVGTKEDGKEFRRLAGGEVNTILVLDGEECVL